MPLDVIDKPKSPLFVPYFDVSCIFVFVADIFFPKGFLGVILCLLRIFAGAIVYTYPWTLLIQYSAQCPSAISRRYEALRLTHLALVIRFCRLSCCHLGNLQGPFSRLRHMRHSSKATLCRSIECDSMRGDCLTSWFHPYFRGSPILRQEL